MTDGAFFQDLAVLMVAAGFISAIFGRLGWPKVLGYILTGAVMGEHTWGGSFLSDPQSIKVIGQLGVVFLMFSMGISFSGRDMRKIQSVAFPAAIFDVVVMTWLGYNVGTKLFGWAAVPSLFLGVAICDSATTLLAKVIDEMGWGRRMFAKYTLGTSVCEDILCVGAIAVVTGVARGGGMSFGAFAASLGWLFVFFLAILVFGFITVPRLLKSIGRRKDAEALLLVVLGVCFFVSFVAYRFDFSLALGAFLVGIIASTSDEREKIASLVEPLKSMWAAVFFVTIGLLIDPGALWRHLPAILLVSAVVVVGKTFNITLASLLSGVSVKTSVQTGLSLAQIGEFAFMVAILYADIVEDADTPMFQIAVGVSLLTTLLNPTMIRASDRLGDWAERHQPHRLRAFLSAYGAWLEKLRASHDTPAFILLKAAATRLGVYAVLIVAVAALCHVLQRADYSRFSTFFEEHDDIIFFIIANIFTISLLPLVLSAARALGEEVAAILTGDGNSRWQISIRQFARTLVVVAILGLVFVEWTMINVTIAPTRPFAQGAVYAIIIITGLVGWRFFVRAGRRANDQLHAALTAEERREGLVQTMTISVPEGTIQRLTLNAESPAVGSTVGALNVRAKTGAAVVSVYRNGVLTRNIGPDWEFSVGDTLVVLGEPQQVAALKDLLGVTA